MSNLTGEMLYKHAIGHHKQWIETSTQSLFNEAARQLNEELRTRENEDIKVLLKAFNDLLTYHLFGQGDVTNVLNEVLKVLQRHPDLAEEQSCGIIDAKSTMKPEGTMTIKDIGEATRLLKEFISLLTDEELM